MYTKKKREEGKKKKKLFFYSLFINRFCSKDFQKQYKILIETVSFLLIPKETVE